MCSQKTSPTVQCTNVKLSAINAVQMESDSVCKSDQLTAIDFNVANDQGNSNINFNSTPLCHVQAIDFTSIKVPENELATADKQGIHKVQCSNLCSTCTRNKSIERGNDRSTKPSKVVPVSKENRKPKYPYRSKSKENKKCSTLKVSKSQVRRRYGTSWVRVQKKKKVYNEIDELMN